MPQCWTAWKKVATPVSQCWSFLDKRRDASATKLACVRHSAATPMPKCWWAWKRVAPPTSQCWSTIWIFLGKKVATPVSQCWSFLDKRRNAYVAMLVGLERRMQRMCHSAALFLTNAATHVTKLAFIGQETAKPMSQCWLAWEKVAAPVSPCWTVLDKRHNAYVTKLASIRQKAATPASQCWSF